MSTYNQFIKQNVALEEAAAIGVIQDGKVVGKIPLDTLEPTYETKIYSFGALSDVHNSKNDYYGNYAYPIQDLENALTYLKNYGASFASICGDLTIKGKIDELKYCQNAAKKVGWTFNQNENGLHAYTCLGNHEMLTTYWNHEPIYESNVEYYQASKGSVWIEFLGRTDVDGSHNNDKHQVITYGNDVFIYFSLNSAEEGGTPVKNVWPYIHVYNLEDMKWLYNQLMMHRNQRCFIFTHMFMPDKCGNYGKTYNHPMDDQSSKWFDLLFKKFTNAIWFSGHSHWVWEAQGLSIGSSSDKGNNYDANIYPPNTTEREYGWAIHLPSCACPKKPTMDGGYEDVLLGSQFAVIDVFENAIVIKGITQIAQSDSEVVPDNLKQMPITQYYLNTTLKFVDDSPIEEFNI